jgi:hypothetical protein
MYPTYSGFGPWRPAVETIPIVGISLVVTATALAVGALARWPQVLTRSSWLAVGGLSGLWSVLYLALHWSWSAAIGGPSTEVLCLAGSLATATWGRWWHAQYAQAAPYLER